MLNNLNKYLNIICHNKIKGLLHIRNNPLPFILYPKSAKFQNLIDNDTFSIYNNINK